MRKKTLSAFLGLVLGASTILGSVGANPVPVSAGTDGITDSECTTTGTAEPASDEVVPDANQYKYQKDELHSVTSDRIHLMKLSGENITETKHRTKSLH